MSRYSPNYDPKIDLVDFRHIDWARFEGPPGFDGEKAAKALRLLGPRTQSPRAEPPSTYLA